MGKFLKHSQSKAGILFVHLELCLGGYRQWVWALLWGTHLRKAVQGLLGASWGANYKDKFVGELLARVDKKPVCDSQICHGMYS